MVNPVSTGKMAAGPVENMQPAVLYKLIIFAVAMAVVPIGTYYVVLSYFTKGIVRTNKDANTALFDTGNTIASAIAAIVTANLVLIAYIVVAWLEGPPGLPPSGKGVGEIKKDK
uniref:Vacuolar ATPase assembly integral membrane protein VMA21 n=1 Tax=Kwoniella pini CBS 10737 TaxID=1296096 RepID=A0A1B9ICT0_9TREE|nr:uncharacterized protein I206_00594 [Kwoniella pini CBS 10737]OCF53293.1 hypothetical protein I206_00594 [Kwoniella pini CBS 10737]